MNKGKEFEQDVKVSLQNDSNLWVYRPSDFGGGQAARFTNHSLCDFIVFNNQSRILTLLELKSVKGKSISCPSIELISQIQDLEVSIEYEENTEKKKKLKETLKTLLKKANGYNIKWHQILSLIRIAEKGYTAMSEYFVINFREENKTFIISPNDLLFILENNKKSSINISDLEDSYALLVPATQIRNTKHYNYDLNKWIY